MVLRELLELEESDEFGLDDSSLLLLLLEDREIFFLFFVFLSFWLFFPSRAVGLLIFLLGRAVAPASCLGEFGELFQVRELVVGLAMSFF
jgi:ABC-type tungstate transport system substrate-binding protein